MRPVRQGLPVQELLIAENTEKKISSGNHGIGGIKQKIFLRIFRFSGLCGRANEKFLINPFFGQPSGLLSILIYEFIMLKLPPGNFLMVKAEKGERRKNL